MGASLLLFAGSKRYGWLGIWSHLIYPFLSLDDTATTEGYVHERDLVAARRRRS